MDKDKPLITRNQAIYAVHQSKKKKIVKMSRKKFIIREISLVIFTFILFFIIANYPAFSVMTKYWFNKDDQSNAQIKIDPKPADPTPAPAPAIKLSVISIPKINVNAPIIWDIKFDDIHANLDNGVVHYNESAHPGQIGNMFIVGHSSDFVWSKGKYKTIFALLPKLAYGDQINISYNNKDYIYEVFYTKITTADDIDIVKPSSDAQLTLMTCWPIGTSQKRYVVQAKLISPAPNGRQTVYPSILGLPASR